MTPNDDDVHRAACAHPFKPLQTGRRSVRGRARRRVSVAASASGRVTRR